eukprot:766975-Amphidinium_carterae.1
MEDGVHHLYDLNEHNIEYLTHLPGDTLDDDKHLQQIAALEDDLQSIEDEEFYAKRRQEEIDYPEHTFWTRDQLEGHQEEMEHAYRWEKARDRQQRRDDGEQKRFKGNKEELQKMRDALLDIT